MTISEKLPNPRILELRWNPMASGRLDRTISPIDGIKALRLCGVGLLHAKRAFEEMMALGRGAVLLPDVPDEDLLIEWLVICRCEGKLVDVPATTEELRRVRTAMDLTADLDIAGWIGR